MNNIIVLLLELLPLVTSNKMSEDTLALTPKAVARLQAATEKASRDFRSDVVPVPIQAMMQVRAPVHGSPRRRRLLLS